MSAETLIENLQDIRTDAMDMIKNIEHVKGMPYAVVVHSLLVSRQLADIQNIMLGIAAQGGPQEVMDAAHNAWSTCVCQLIANVGKAADISPELLQEAMAHSDSIGDKYQALIEKAVKSERTGSGFGGRDAP